MKTYPRLLISHRYVPIMVKVGAGHKTMDLQRRWCVVFVRSPLPREEYVHYTGRDDGLWGWAECVDFASAVIAKAGAS